ncbi:hypothetical protein DA482_10525 [Pseudomonas fluorescens]|nr:hypothetical protein D0N73_29545 [Pseudomonas fluorescens]TWR43381.1 hypothetical protein FIP59_28975 [Pseudomonas fluorescens]
MRLSATIGIVVTCKVGAGLPAMLAPRCVSHAEWLPSLASQLPLLDRVRYKRCGDRFRVKNTYRLPIRHNDYVVPIEQLRPHTLPSLPTPKTRRKSSWKVQL